MKKLIFLSIFTSAFYFGYSQNNGTVKLPEITKETKPWTRWWWLGNDVDSINLTYNLDALAKAGIGGVEITPIYGVKNRESHYIKYLSPKWMNMLGFTTNEATRLKMGVDMNTGTGWPFGGPEISVKDAATKAIFQHYEVKKGGKLYEKIVVNDPKQKDASFLDKLMAFSSKGIKIDITDKVANDGTLNWTAPKNENYKLIALFVGKTLQKVKRAAPGGEGYVLDHLNKEAVTRYLHKYDRAFAESKTPFPQDFFNDSYEVYDADWTPDLLTQFEKRRGYKLQNYFPELLDKCKTAVSTRVISDYRETVSELIRDNFTVVWNDWAHSHGAKTKNQAHGSPANLLDLYAAVDIPECESFGISNFDIPLLRRDSVFKKNDGDPTVLKYATSAAHVAGKKYASSETLTWLTEHFRTSLSQCKAEIDQMFASGVNHTYFHGTTYSPKEAAWPGYKFYASIDMSPTNSIWKDAPAFFDYITRVQSFMQAGKSDNDFLLYLPIYDMWEKPSKNYYMTFAIHDMKERIPEFLNGVEKILQCGYDLDYISDHFIATTTIENGKLKTEGGSQYKALILPAVKRIPVETLAKVNELIKKGATVIFADNYPADIQGLNLLKERRKTLNKLKKQLPLIKSFDVVSVKKMGLGNVITGRDYKELLAKTDANSEEFVSKFGGQLIRRVTENGNYYFMTMLKNNPVDGFVTLAVKAKSAMIYDPLTQKSGKAKLIENNGKTQIYLQLKPGQSVIIQTFTDKNLALEDWKYYQENTSEKIILKDNWKLNFTESEPAIKDTFKLVELASWTDFNHPDLKRNMGTGKYAIKFYFNKKSNEYRLSLGDVRESAKVFLNGQFVQTLFSVPFETNIGKHLKNGENFLEVEVTNLPANRISDYDKRGVEWRIFNEINFVDVTYNAKTRYDKWQTSPSGLLGPVVIQELKEMK